MSDAHRNKHHQHGHGIAAGSGPADVQSGASAATDERPATAHAGHHAGHGDMVADYQRRFWVSLVLTIPVLILSPMVRDFAGQGMTPLFTAEEWVALALSSIIYFWGGWPFLTGALPEIRTGRPGMMTLVALAISTAYFYSAAVTLGLPGDHHAAGSLAGNAVGSRRIAGTGGTGAPLARHRTAGDGRWRH